MRSDISDQENKDEYQLGLLVEKERHKINGACLTTHKLGARSLGQIHGKPWAREHLPRTAVQKGLVSYCFTWLDRVYMSSLRRRRDRARLTWLI